MRSVWTQFSYNLVTKVSLLDTFIPRTWKN